ncbi:unnamed protein product [Meloidogyne enterolobii]|uniref:Uncharacterized protein n=1 Tax=Meloidogyne enterolobii TaxID=390850 RepID=A0ACB1B034_MELEN
MYLKLIFYIFFLLILINISIGIKCKCPENGKKKLRHSRFKRSSNCSCLGSGERQDNYSENESYETNTEREASGGQHRVSEYSGEGKGEGFAVEEASYSNYGQEGTSYGGGAYEGESSMRGDLRTYKDSEIEEVNGKKKVLYICVNYLFSHVQLHVN